MEQMPYLGERDASVRRGKHGVTGGVRIDTAGIGESHEQRAPPFRVVVRAPLDPTADHSSRPIERSYRPRRRDREYRTSPRSQACARCVPESASSPTFGRVLLCIRRPAVRPAGWGRTEFVAVA